MQRKQFIIVTKYTLVVWTFFLNFTRFSFQISPFHVPSFNNFIATGEKKKEFANQILNLLVPFIFLPSLTYSCKYECFMQPPFYGFSMPSWLIILYNTLGSLWVLCLTSLQDFRFLFRFAFFVLNSAAITFFLLFSIFPLTPAID